MNLSILTPENEKRIDQALQVKMFGELLMKCLALGMRRNPERKEEIREFVRQAIHDSQYLVQGKLPSDIIELIKEQKKCQ